MTQHNKRLQVPRYAPLSPQGIHRQPFLDGTIRCLYGPGQYPNAWPDTGLPGPNHLADGSGSSDPVEAIPYAKPDDWPDSGTLLRVPQVVHLSCAIDQVAGKPLSDGTFEGLHEAQRVLAVYAAVQSQLQKLRKNRTWAVIVDWFNVLGLIPSTEGDGFYFLVDQYPHMVGPPAASATLSWFGVNYFHVYCGHWIPDYLDGGDPSSPFRNFESNTSLSQGTPFDVTSDLYARARTRVTANYDHFAGYGAALYGFESPSGAPFASDYGGDFQLQLSAQDLVDYGFTHQGFTHTLNANNLMSMIATQFKFDPVTGKDLPFG